MKPRAVWAIVASLVVLCACASAADFRAPGPKGWVVWEAEKAIWPGGSVRVVQDPRASGGAYVQPAAAVGATLQFKFRVPSAARLKVRPVWWPSGEQRWTRPFPYPLEQRYGPACLQAVGPYVFFIAPATGRVACFDPSAGRVVAQAKLGGYLTDLAADRRAGTLYVADALNDKLYKLSAGGPAGILSVLACVQMPAEPWAIAVGDGRVLVACRAAREVVAYDKDLSQVLGRVKTPARPVAIELSGKRALVRFQQMPFDAQTAESLPGDQLFYAGQGSHSSIYPARGTNYRRARTGVIRATVGGRTREIDVSSVTSGPAGQPPAGCRVDLGPANFALVGKRLFFAAPSVGRVGVVDTSSWKVVKSIDLGGYPLDLCAAGNKVYVGDVAGKRVVVIDAGSLSVARTIDLGDEPWNLQYFRDAPIQRSYLVPPTKINRVFVACRGGTLAAIDASSDKVVARVPLHAPARSVHVVPLPNTGWWPLLNDDRIKFALHPKVAIEPAPLWIDAGQMRAIGHDWYVAEQPASKDRAVVEIAGEAEQRPLAVAAEWTPKIDGDLSEWNSKPAIELGADASAKPSGYASWAGPSDLSAQVWLAWDASALYLAARVRDDEHYQPYSAERIWEGDCIQIAFDLGRTGSYDREWGFALTRSGPVAYCWYGPPETASQIKLNVRRVGEATLYEVAIPWAALSPLKPKEGNVCGFSLVVMDADGTSWQGGLEWTGGIMNGKDPSKFGLLALLPDAAPATVAKLRARLGKRRMVDVRGCDYLLLRVDGQPVDVSEVCDPQLAAQRPLTSRDAIGSMTFSVDGGPEFDWMRGMWMTPDDQVFLVNDTEEFWAWNAPIIEVGPGEHTLTVRLRGPTVRLDAVAVKLDPPVQVQVRPEPWRVHGRVPLYGYKGVFYYNEPIEFTLSVRNRGASSLPLTVRWTLLNYMDEPEVGPCVLRGSAGPGQTWRHRLRLKPDSMGRFTLVLNISTPAGETTRWIRFLRQPKLTHPRLMFRPEHVQRIKVRAARYRRLVERYVAWLRRQVKKTGNFPERFLPNALTRQGLGKAAPPEMQPTRLREQTYGWRMYELGWRVIACEFAALYLQDKVDHELLDPVIDLLRNSPSTSYYCMYHHHGPFFPGAVATMLDLLPDDIRNSLKLTDYLRSKTGQMNVMPWTLVTMEEPLTPKDRALLYKLAIHETNLERYLDVHCGKRGGRWWLNPWTGCHCPNHGIFLTFLYMSNFFDEPRTFEKPFLGGFLTFQRFADPIRDNRRLLPSRRGPLGEPWHWLFACLTRHPLEKGMYAFDEWVQKLNSEDLGGDEQQAVDELMALKDMPFTGPLRGGAHHFVTGVVVPVALVLGWYDPQAPEVSFSELPPTVLFDKEGWAIMRSGWDENATEVYFMSGLRDHTTRVLPNHFMIWRAGEALVGMPALWGDDGNCTPAWGNVPVAGKVWLNRWRLNLEHPREAEHCTINRFTKPTFTYIARDRALFGYAPAENGWGGGIDLHGHTETFQKQEGQLLAFQTTPMFDYVAGRADNAWLPSEIRRAERQLVYIKPDIVVVYDRVELGPEGKPASLQLCVAGGLELTDYGFRATSGGQEVQAVVLLPKRARVSDPAPYSNYQWKGQKLVVIEPPSQGRFQEYLVVYRVGEEGIAPPNVRVEVAPSKVEVIFAEPKRLSVGFNRRGPVGGYISLPDKHQRIALAEGVEDDYSAWASDPHFEAWLAQPRFRFLNISARAR